MIFYSNQRVLTLEEILRHFPQIVGAKPGLVSDYFDLTPPSTRSKVPVM